MGKDEDQSGRKLQSVLFVCTGNIFRSVTAEYALKARLGAGTSCAVRSTGIDAKPQSIHAWVQTRLHEKGSDSNHPRPTTTQQGTSRGCRPRHGDGMISDIFVQTQFGHAISS